MKKVAIPAGLVLLVLALLVAALAFESGHHSKGDSDKRSDCWAHADRFGHRHCAS